MTSATSALQVSCTVGSRDAADALARAVVDDGLAACVQVVGPIESTFRWEGEVETATEWLLLIKTTAKGFPRLRDAIVERHAYEAPEIVAVPIADGNRPYLDWVADSVR